MNRLNRIRQERNNDRVEEMLSVLRTAAEEDQNTMPCIMDAVREYATLGEITDVLRSVFGEYQEPTWI